MEDTQFGGFPRQPFLAIKKKKKKTRNVSVNWNILFQDWDVQK